MGRERSGRALATRAESYPHAGANGNAKLRRLLHPTEVPATGGGSGRQSAVRGGVRSAAGEGGGLAPDGASVMLMAEGGDAMTEAEWLAGEDPETMLGFVRGTERNRLPERKSRLFGVACCRQLGSLVVDARSRNALNVAERYADGDATADDLDAAYEEAFDVEVRYAEHPDRGQSTQLEALGRAANAVAEACHPDELAEGIAHEALTAGKAAGTSGLGVALAYLVRDIFGNPFRPVVFSPEWRTDTALSLARQMYDSRDFSAMPILADALQDAGCDDDGVLAHCREPREHARGCWVVDLLLGKQ